MDNPQHPVLQEQVEVITLAKEDEEILIDVEGPVQVVQEEQESITTDPPPRSRVYNALKCSKCNKRFKNPTLLQQHVKLHRGPTVYKCGQCHETFNDDLGKFLEHREIHPPVARKKRKTIEYNNANAAFQIGV